MLIAITADTHVTRDRTLPAAVAKRLSGAGLVLHAGDFLTARALDQLEALGPPLLAVHGNRDDPEVVERLPETAETEAGGIRFALIHDAGTAKGRLERMRARFPEADVVVFGHSHMPLHEEREGFHIFNPGSPTHRRRAPHHTFGLATVERGRVALRHVRLD